MNVFLGEISVPLDHGELISLIATHSEKLAKDINNSGDRRYFQQTLDRINVLTAKLKEFEQQAEQNNG